MATTHKVCFDLELMDGYDPCYVCDREAALPFPGKYLTRPASYAVRNQDGHRTVLVCDLHFDRLTRNWDQLVPEHEETPA